MKVQNIADSRVNSNEKCCLPNFGYTRTKLGKEIDAFIKLRKPSHEQKTDLFCKLVSFVQKMQKSIEEPLGEGFRGLVYKIDDKYVVKTGKKETSFNGGLMPLERIPYDKLKTYYGKPILKFSNEVQVLKNVSSMGSHFPVGIPYKMPFDSDAQMSLYWNNKCLPRYAALPQKSFDALAKDFATLNNFQSRLLAFIFDVTNPNNFVITGKNSLRIVDDIDIKRPPRKNTIASLMSPFLESMSLIKSVPNSADNAPLRKRLLKKIILAGEKYELPYVSNELSTVSLSAMYEEKTWGYVCRDFCNYTDLIKELNLLRITQPDKKVRLQQVEKLLDEMLQYGFNG